MSQSFAQKRRDAESGKRGSQAGGMKEDNGKRN